MKKLFILTIIALGIMANAWEWTAGRAATHRNGSGQITGTSTHFGNTATHRNSYGQTTGESTRSENSWQHRSTSGGFFGSASWF